MLSDHLRNFGYSENIHRVVKNLFRPLHLPGPLAGRLKLYVQHWRKLTNDKTILNTITGWNIPFMQKPFQKTLQNFISHKTLEDLITLEVSSMLEKGAITKAVPLPDQVISNIFLREKREEGTYRPIINLKHVNQFIPYQKFKMETLKNVKTLLMKGDYLVKLDLKDAYFSVPLNENSRKYTRFEWLGNLYEFTCLMFGLGPAPKVFTKIMKIPISLLRRLI